MAVEVSIHVETALEGFDLANKQVKFACSRAINDMAWNSMGVAREKLPSQFTVRRDWITRGFRATKATRRQLKAELFHLDPYMERQEFGGVKQPLSGRSIAIPGQAIRPEGASKDPTRIAKRRWPREAMKRDRVFTRVITKQSRWRGAVVMLERQKGKVSGKRRFRTGAKTKRGAWALRKRKILRRDVRVLYHLVRRGNVRPHLGLARTVNQVVVDQFRERFLLRYEEAIATATMPVEDFGMVTEAQG